MAAVSPPPPTKGSTAPAITSPLMAWPARPVERSSPLTSPSTPSSFGARPDIMYSRTASSSSSLTVASGESSKERDSFVSKGKVDQVTSAPEVVVSQDERKFAKPTKPLTPNQLGRIAQSFGIVIPSLPHPSPSFSPSSRYERSPTLTSTRKSPHLLTVIPPSILLTGQVDEEKRRRWRRGKLLPLQPTMGSMLLSIAREYGLPSTRGLALYLVVGPSSASSSSSTMSTDECAGPLISTGTWTTLFPQHSHASSSRLGSPADTPVRPQGSFRDNSIPPSPLALVERQSERARINSLTSATDKSSLSQSLSATSSLSSNLPLTPTSAAPTSSIVGTIEFDVDPNEAVWLDEWRRTTRGTRRRTSSTLSDSSVPFRSGKRELRLVRKVEQEKKRPIDFSAADDDSSASHEISQGDATLVVGIEEDDFPFPQYREAGRRFSVRQGTTAISVSASMDQFTENDQPHEEVDPNFLRPEMPEAMSLDFLASPIELEKAQLERVRLGDGKRGSGLVMAEQLDDLERIMRQLSPREIRLTSPRELTPRMAAKIAATKLGGANLAVPHTRSTPTSPLASSTIAPKPVPPPLPPRRSHVHKPASLDASREVSEPESETTVEPSREPLDKPSWPAVPFDSPSSPSIDEFFRPQATGAGISAETLRRMQASPPTEPAPGWKPVRPPRPNSPDLFQFGHARTLSHTLSPELVDQIKSPGSVVAGESPLSPESEVKAGKPRLRGRAGSVSIKGLRHHMSGKNLNLTWGEKEKKDEVPALPSTTLASSIAGKDKETVGLFKGATDHQHSSSFASLRDSIPHADINEFGQSRSQAPPSHPTHHPDSRLTGDKPGLASRLFSFGRRGSTKDHKDTPQAQSVAQRSVSAPKASSISSPITSSFHKVDETGKRSSEYPTHVTAHNAAAMAVQAVEGGLAGVSPQSPASPRSVRRKPVPGFEGVSGDGGMTGSESMSSMRSFVLEDPPKRRPKNLA